MPSRGSRELRWRSGLSMGVIVALAVAVWAAFASGDSNDGATTTTTAPATTVSAPSSTVVPTTTTPSTTTAAPPSTAASTTADPGARQEEVRQILEELYYRWFEAIYHNDEEAVREVVATEANLEDFRSATATMDLPSEPRSDDIVIRDVEILRDEPNCLVAFFTLDVSTWRGDGTMTTGVDVLLPIDGEWRLATSWENKGDLWEADCLIEPDLS